MTIRRFVPATKHNAEATSPNVGTQHLRETLLVHLHIAGDLYVPKVPGAAQEFVEPCGPRIRRKAVQSGANRGRPGGGTHTPAIATNPLIGRKANHRGVRSLPGVKPATQESPYARVIRRCFRLSDLSWNES